MYSVLIVDDERIIRNGIRQMIPWEKIGVGGVFTADSGESALELIRREQPDILLTDIRMTEMDGLALIRQVNELHPAIRIIVLTGYDNFEYVQECCRLNVQDFILKPADEEELTRVIAGQTGALDRQKGVEQYQKVMRRAQGAAEQFRLEQVLRGSLHGTAPPGELEALLAEYQYRPDQPMHAVILALAPEPDGDWRDHADLLAMTVKNTCIELFDIHCEGITFEDDENIVIALFSGAALDEAVDRMENLRSLLQEEFHISPRIAIGHGAAGFAELAASYADARQLLIAAQPHQQLVQSGNAERRQKMFGEAFGELKRAITSNTGNPEKIMRSFEAFTVAVESYHLSLSTVRRCCFDIACSLYYNYVVDTGEIADNKLSALLSSLLVCSREEVCKFTRAFMAKLLGDDDESHDIITKAKQYIADNLAQELSVANIAARLYITPNYFSRLFKRVTGEGCNEYIVRKRMEMAKSLLLTTDYKTGKIAGIAGYRDTNYFSLAFKKYTGCSPTHYRESMQGG